MASTRSRTLPGGEKRYDVVWRCSGCEKHPALGKQHVKTFVRKKDADVFELEKTREEIAGEPIVPTQESVTFGAFAGLSLTDGKVIVGDEGWFGRYRTTVRPGSYKRRTDAKNWLVPLIDVPLERVTAALVDDTVTAVGQKHPRTAKVVLETIRMILRNARIRGHKIDEMVLLPPRDGGLRSARYAPADKTFLTYEEVGLLAEVSGHDDLVWFTTLTGLRGIEAFGLTDAHLIRENGKVVAVHITRDITKSDAGVRTIPLEQEQRERLLRAMLARKQGSRYIFPGERGGAMNRSWFDKQMRVWTEKVGVTATFHALRHTFASWMIAANVNPKTLQVLMGHESWSVTMDTYGHLFPTATSEAMVQLQRSMMFSGLKTSAEVSTVGR
jgi:integrase